MAQEKIAAQQPGYVVSVEAPSVCLVIDVVRCVCVSVCMCACVCVGGWGEGGTKHELQCPVTSP